MIKNEIAFRRFYLYKELGNSSVNHVSLIYKLLLFFNLSNIIVCNFFYVCRVTCLTSWGAIPYSYVIETGKKCHIITLQ